MKTKSKSALPRKRRVLIIGCGGTIAMVPRPSTGVLEPAKSVKDILKLVPALAHEADVELIQIENLDSSELNQSHWTKFAAAIAKAVATKKYDGIIVLHGTDTMAYSATAVAFVLGKELPIPVVFTGSQLPLVHFGTDARFNLENSMKVVLQARKENIAEVVIVFDKLVLRATRAIKISEAAFNAFNSPAFEPLAIITATGVKFGPEARRVKSGSHFDIHDLDLKFAKGVVVLDLVPGLEPDTVFGIIRSGNCQALILRSLGAGNVPSRDGLSLIPCIKEATYLKIPVFITTKFVGGTTHAGIYGPGHAALQAGAIESGDLTDVAVQVKVMWLLGQGIRTIPELRKALLKPVVGEVTG